MSTPSWILRSARRSDGKLLSSFSCAELGVPWEAEVEEFIQNQLYDWFFDPLAKDQDPRLLLLLDRRSKELVGLAAHERSYLRYGDQEPFAATKLEVLAVARAWQGKSFASGVRVSDVLMSAVMADVNQRVPPRHARIFAVVHEQNVRSIAVCQRHGLTAELSRPSPMYRRLVTE
jgi:GNAT superfamily N-acetyltransferase